MKIVINNVVLDAMLNSKATAKEKRAAVEIMLGKDMTEEAYYKYVGLKPDANLHDLDAAVLSKVYSQLKGVSPLYAGDSLEVSATPQTRTLTRWQRFARIFSHRFYAKEASDIERYNMEYSTILANASLIVSSQVVEPIVEQPKVEKKEENSKTAEPKKEYLKDIETDEITADFDMLSSTKEKGTRIDAKKEEIKEPVLEKTESEESKKSYLDGFDDDEMTSDFANIPQTKKGIRVDTTKKEESKESVVEKIEPVKAKTEETSKSELENPTKESKEDMDIDEINEDFTKLASTTEKGVRITSTKKEEPKVEEEKSNSEELSKKEPVKANVVSTPAQTTKPEEKKPVSATPASTTQTPQSKNDDNLEDSRYSEEDSYSSYDSRNYDYNQGYYGYNQGYYDEESYDESVSSSRIEEEKPVKTEEKPQVAPKQTNSEAPKTEEPKPISTPIVNKSNTTKTVENPQNSAKTTNGAAKNNPNVIHEDYSFMNPNRITEKDKTILKTTLGMTPEEFLEAKNRQKEFERQNQQMPGEQTMFYYGQNMLDVCMNTDYWYFSKENLIDVLKILDEINNNGKRDYSTALRPELEFEIDGYLSSTPDIKKRLLSFVYPMIEKSDTPESYSAKISSMVTHLPLTEDNAEWITLASFNVKELEKTLEFVKKNPSLSYLTKTIEYKTKALTDKTQSSISMAGGFVYPAKNCEKFVIQNVLGLYNSVYKVILNGVSSNKLMAAPETKQAMTKIDTMSKTPSNTTLKVASKKNSFFIDLGKAVQQTSRNGCWSCSLHEQLKFHKVNLSQEEIRAFKPHCGNEYVKDDTLLSQLKNRINFAYRSSTDTVSTVFEYTELIHKTVKDAVVHQMTIHNQPGDTIKNLLIAKKVPISITNGGHYTTIVGYEGDKYLYLDSNIKDPTKAFTNEPLVQKYNCCVGKLSDIPKNSEIVWIENNPKKEFTKGYELSQHPHISTNTVELYKMNINGNLENISISDTMAKDLGIGPFEKKPVAISLDEEKAKDSKNQDFQEGRQVDKDTCKII